AGAGTNSCSSSNRFGASATVIMDMPVTLPLGRLRLVTRPNVTGSPALTKTIGIVDVAAFAARPEWIPPTAAIAVTWRRTKSEASAGNRHVLCLTRGPGAEITNPRQRRLLRSCSEWPSQCRSAHERDELASSHELPRTRPII